MAVATRCLLAAICLAAARAVVFDGPPFRENAVCEVQGRPLGSCVTAESCKGVGGVPGASCGLPHADSSSWRCCQPSAQLPAARPDHGVRSRQACRQYRKASETKSCDNFTPLLTGREVRQGDFPYFAGVGYAVKSDGEIMWSCGGGLISENFVLTSAVCAYASTRIEKPLKVRLGALYFGNKGNRSIGRDDIQEYDVETIIVHPEFSGEKGAFYHDIALLRLAGKARFSKDVQPACLYPEEQIPVERAVVAGFGIDGVQAQFGTLQKVDIPLVPDHKCTEFYREYARPLGIDSTTQFCAGEKGRDTCPGDSGAPLVVKEGIPTCAHQIIGLASFGAEQCGSIPGVYTKVFSYLPWIEKTIWG